MVAMKWARLLGSPCGRLALDSLPVAEQGSVGESLHHPESRGLSSSCLSSSHEATCSLMAVTHASRSFMLRDTGSRLLHIVTWSLHSILSMALSSHVSLKCLLALNAGCSSTACSLPFAKGCPACRNIALGPGIGDSSLNIPEWYSCCTVLSMPLPWDVAVIPASSIAGRHMSGTTNGVPCITSLGTWV